MTRKTLLGVFVIGLLVAADDKKTGDADKLKGNWTTVSIEVDGKKLPVNKIDPKSITFYAGKAFFFQQKSIDYPGMSIFNSGDYKIDASQNPAHLDVALDNTKAKTLKMIYQIDDDTLKIGRTKESFERPKGFDDKDIVIITLKREQP